MDFILMCTMHFHSFVEKIIDMTCKFLDIIYIGSRRQNSENAVVIGQFILNFYVFPDSEFCKLQTSRINISRHHQSSARINGTNGGVEICEGNNKRSLGRVSLSHMDTVP